MCGADDSGIFAVACLDVYGGFCRRFKAQPGTPRDYTTHTLLASLVVTSLFSMITTRFCADMIYEKKYSLLFPSFFGSIWMMLIIGGAGTEYFCIFRGCKAVISG